MSWKIQRMATWSENKNTPKPFTIYLNHDLNILNHYGFGPSLTTPLTIRKIKAYNFIGSFSCLFLSLISECKCNLYQFDRSISVFVGTGRHSQC